MSTTERTGADAVTAGEHVDLLVGGMTCASCVARVEKLLNRLEGVRATVNLATASASVDYDPTSTPEADLLATVERTGYTAAVASPDGGEVGAGDNDADEAATLRRRLLLAVPLSVAVVVLTMTPLGPSSASAAAWLPWASLALTTPVVLFCGWRFHRAAVVNARHGASTMDTLVSLGTLAAFGWSVVQTLGGGGHLYYEVAVSVTTFLLIGRWLEARAKSRAGSALRELLSLGARKAVRLEPDGSEREVDAAMLRPGDTVLVRPGEQVPADGVVREGRAALDESMLTGEGLPVDREVGDEVIGATIDTDGRLVVEITRVGRDTVLSRIAAVVTRAQTGKAPVQRLADRISGVFVPVVLALALLTLLGRLLTGHPAYDAFTAAVAVLVIACPCALGLATPTALLVGTGRAAQLGIVIRSAEVLEATRRIDTVVLDKTGTLTTGVMSVHEATGLDPGSLRLVGELESASGHPVARAVTAYAAEQRAGRPDRPEVTDFADHAGRGVSGLVGGHRVGAGRPPESTDALPAVLARAVGRARDAGRTAVLVSVDDAPVGVLAVGDTVRDDSAAAVRALRELGLDTVLLSGDHESAARQVAEQLRIDRVLAGVLPEGKLDEVERLRAEGRVVLMVGDGVNDAAALVAADLGVAMGSGSAVAIESADVTVMRGSVAEVATAIALSRRTLRTIRANLGWAFGYNLVGLPLAALGLLDPMYAGAAMALSSVSVVANSLRLRRFRP